MTYALLIINVAVSSMGRRTNFLPEEIHEHLFELSEPILIRNVRNFFISCKNFHRKKVILILLLLLICNTPYLGWVASCIKGKVRKCLRCCLSHTELFKAAKIAWLDASFFIRKVFYENFQPQMFELKFFKTLVFTRNYYLFLSRVNLTKFCLYLKDPHKRTRVS